MQLTRVAVQNHQPIQASLVGHGLQGNGIRHQRVQLYHHCVRLVATLLRPPSRAPFIHEYPPNGSLLTIT